MSKIAELILFGVLPFLLSSFAGSSDVVRDDESQVSETRMVDDLTDDATQYHPSNDNDELV